MQEANALRPTGEAQGGRGGANRRPTDSLRGPPSAIKFLPLPAKRIRESQCLCAPPSEWTALCWPLVGQPKGPVGATQWARVASTRFHLRQTLFGWTVADKKRQ